MGQQLTPVWYQSIARLYLPGGVRESATWNSGCVRVFA
jgi:hypothetical protein